MIRIPTPLRRRRGFITPVGRAGLCVVLGWMTAGLSCDQGGTGNPSPCSSIADAIHILLDTGECVQLTSVGYTLETAALVFQVQINSRELPTEIAYGEARLILTWADDASSLRILITDAGESETVEFPIDLSDPALLAALDDYEARTGTDATALRDYIAANPGLIFATATGAGPRGRVKAVEFGTDKPRVDTAQNRPAYRNMQEYIDGVERHWMRPAVWAQQQRGAIARAGREPTRLESLAIDGAEAMGDFFSRVWQNQQAACFPCTAACGFGCMGSCWQQIGGGITVCSQARSTECLPPDQFTPGAGCTPELTGACCVDFLGLPRGCHQLSPTACDDVGGVFFFGETCLGRDCNLVGGACCLDSWDCREVASHEACELLARQTNNFWFTFRPGESCAATQAAGGCNRGVCCYGDGSYNCEYTNEAACIRSGIDSERAATWIRGRCEAATCR